MRKIVGIILIGLFFITMGCGCEKSNITEDEKKFKEEYEAINGEQKGDKKVMSLEIEEDNHMKYIDSGEVLSVLENKTGVIYFGFPLCPWCRNVVPILIEAAKDAGLDTVYYANLLEERDQKKLDDSGEIVTEKKGSANYHKIVEKLKDHLGVYEGLEDDAIKRLYFPTVVFVKNGKVEDIHIGTLDSQKDPYQKLSKKEQEKLKNIYGKGMKSIQSLTCDTDKTC